MNPVNDATSYNETPRNPVKHAALINDLIGEARNSIRIHKNVLREKHAKLESLLLLSAHLDREIDIIKSTGLTS